MSEKRDTIIHVRDGWIECPYCHRHLLRIKPETQVKSLPVYCRACKREILLDVSSHTGAEDRNDI